MTNPDFDVTENHWSTFRKVSTYWPIIVSALALTVTGASAKGDLDTLKDRVDYLYQNGPPSQADRLARIETRLDAMSKTEDNMNRKIDDLAEGIDALQDGRIHRVRGR